MLKRISSTIVTFGLILIGFSSFQLKAEIRGEEELDLSTMPVQIEGIEGAHGKTFRDGRVLISGQPSEQGLKSFKDLGVTVVVNVRTPKEIENREKVPFDESEVLKGLEIEYVEIPLGGSDYPYRLEAVTRFAEVYKSARGDVLIHCGVAGRAAYLWVAYLIKCHEVDLQDAVRRGRAMVLRPNPLEGLLDRELKLVFAD